MALVTIDTELEICNLAMSRLGSEFVTDITTPANTPQDKACNRVYNQLRDEMLMGLFGTEKVDPYNWEFAKRYQMLNPAAGYATSDYDAITITGITQADPAVVTANSHGFEDGWLVKISDVAGMTEINNFIVRVSGKTTNAFNCYDIDSTNFTAYTSGGEVIRYEADEKWQDGYIYNVPTDFLKAIDITEDEVAWEILGSGNSRRIVSDTDEIVLLYIAQIATVGELPRAFIRAFADRIAYELGPSLSKGNVTADDLYAVYINSLKSAIAADAKNVDPKSLIRDRRRIETTGDWN
jgi:hypothetical protein